MHGEDRGNARSVREMVAGRVACADRRRSVDDDGHAVALLERLVPRDVEVVAEGGVRNNHGDAPGVFPDEALDVAVIGQPRLRIDVAEGHFESVPDGGLGGSRERERGQNRNPAAARFRLAQDLEHARADRQQESECCV